MQKSPHERPQEEILVKGVPGLLAHRLDAEHKGPENMSQRGIPSSGVCSRQFGTSVAAAHALRNL